jgi:hypothetical protein
MPVPWLQIIDAVLGVANYARSGRARTAISPAVSEDQQQLETASRVPGSIEARMAGVVVAALKEAFDRDSRRLELERDQLAAERQRAERALRLELQRQAGDREIGRLRLLAGVAVAGWIGSLLLAMLPGSHVAGAIGPRVALGIGWLLLGVALAASFSGQSHVAATLDAVARSSSGLDESEGPRVTSGAAGASALWLIVGGLALVGLAVLIA